jgi:tRNA (mo5U34)-methyltransferase
MAMTIGELERAAAAFRGRMAGVKRALGPQGFEWYRYDSLANVAHLEGLLTGENRTLPEGRVLDIGCADGELAFFLESMGCEVTAVDYPASNHNHMAGVRRLKEALGSRVEILAMDVDSQFVLPRKDYGLALILGAIYHIKNPFYLLETVSKCARYAVMSTRLARRIPGLAGDARGVSLAYLLGADELNADDSNFWIFTEAGFRQMLRRTNWHVRDYMTVGDQVASDPVSLDRDERVFCFAESRYALANVELLEGWHEPEGSGWRWTERVFSARVRVPVGESRAKLRMKVYVPEGVGELELRASTGDEMRCAGSGFYEFPGDLGAADGRTVTVRFELDRAMAGDASDGRERGVIVYTLEAE